MSLKNGASEPQGAPKGHGNPRSRRWKMRRISLWNVGLVAALWVFLVGDSPLWAHHGGVSLALGPGSPIEANSPLTVPQGGFVVSSRFEHVEWREWGRFEPENKDSFTFFNLGFTYGLTPWLMGSLFIPYNVKRQDTLGTLEGIGDVKLSFSLGFNYNPRKGLSLNSMEDTATTIEGTGTTYFAFMAGATFPTGKWKEKLGGEIDPGMQPGFGSPSLNVGFAASRQIWGPFSMTADVAYDVFTEREHFKFGNEFRFNVAGVYELWGKPEAFVNKIDGILELNLLNVARDEEFGEKLDATGGTILYITPGLRFSFPSIQNMNLGVGVKLPIAKWLNERRDQQGAEGLEKFRVISTISIYF